MGVSFKWHRFPADVIRHAVWLLFRFTLSLRDVEEMLPSGGVEVSYETLRCWTTKFGPQFAKRLKKLRPAPSPRWHLDEMVCRVGGWRMYLWRAFDDEDEVLDLAMQRKRDTEAALTLIKRLLRHQRTKPVAIVTDGLASYPAALAKLDLLDVHRPGRLRENNRAENSHLPIRRREHKQQRFKSQASAQRFLTVLAAVDNTFYTARHLNRQPTLRTAPLEAWSRAASA
jgi:putative transposase